VGTGSEAVVAQFADIKVGKDSSATLGEVAKDDLANLRSTDAFEEPLRAGQKAPHFEATTTDGRTVQVPESYKGKVVLLDFWATWCGPCVKEIPNVVDAYEKYHGRGLEVLSVSLDKQNAGAVLASFTRKHKMPWPQIFDGKYLDTPIARRFCIKSIPHAVIIDGDTRLIVACGEDARGPKLAPAIEDALSKKQSAAR
jgi:peroxiredoxin